MSDPSFDEIMKALTPNDTEFQKILDELLANWDENEKIEVHTILASYIQQNYEFSKMEFISEFLYFIKECQIDSDNIFNIDFPIIKPLLQKYGCKISEKNYDTIEDFIESKEYKDWFKPYKNPKYIKDLPARVDNSDLNSKDIIKDIDQYIEKPLQKAFIELYKKGYPTWYSSCCYRNFNHSKEIEKPYGYILFNCNFSQETIDKYDFIKHKIYYESLDFSSYAIYEYLTP